MKRAGPNENSILDRIRKGSATKQNLVRNGIRMGIGDDAAILRRRAGHETILTCDWFLEGTHFLRAKHPPAAVGWKCLARAVSDIAAMGGVPRCFLLSLSLPEDLTGRWLDEFLSGLHRASRKLDCVLAGGDTTRRNDVLINVTVVGEVKAKRAVLRSGAQPGDVLYVSGRLGAAELGLRILRKSKGRVNSKDSLLKKHLYPEPRLALGQWLANRGLPTAMMDLSDGLSSDLPRLCAASGVGARIQSASLPVAPLENPKQKRTLDPLQLALHGGDDYELLFTVPPSKTKMLPSSFQGIALTTIGTMTNPGRIVLEADGRELQLTPGGWDPFRNSQ